MCMRFCTITVTDTHNKCKGLIILSICSPRFTIVPSVELQMTASTPTSWPKWFQSQDFAAGPDKSPSRHENRPSGHIASMLCRPRTPVL